MDYYKLLEVSPSASTEVIKNAYKTLAKKYHPDTYPGDTKFAEEKMKLLNEAADVLCDEEKRNEYNLINNIIIEDNDDYMRNIENFLSSADYGGYDSDYTDLPDITAIDDTGDENNENIELEEYNENTMEFADPEEQEEPIIPKSREKSKNREKVGRWYYYTITALTAVNLLMIILILTSPDLIKITGFFSGGFGGIKNGDGNISGTEPAIEYGDDDFILATGVDEEDDSVVVPTTTVPDTIQTHTTQAPPEETTAVAVAAATTAAPPASPPVVTEKTTKTVAETTAPPYSEAITEATFPLPPETNSPEGFPIEIDTATEAPVTHEVIDTTEETAAAETEPVIETTTEPITEPTTETITETTVETTAETTVETETIAEFTEENETPPITEPDIPAENTYG